MQQKVTLDREFSGIYPRQGLCECLSNFFPFRVGLVGHFDQARQELLWDLAYSLS
jgi:hypothetical protein